MPVDLRADSPRSGFVFNAMTSAQFASRAYHRRYLVERILVADEPAVIGGPKKSLKTSLAVDLAISLGSGTPFLGHFAVPLRQRTLVLSGESGDATIQELAQRVCAARRIHLACCDVLWQFDLPNVGNPGDRDDLQNAICDAKADVVIIDPLYLCLLAGTHGVSASNLYQVGPLLHDLARACLRGGATPILVHNSTTHAGKAKDDAAKPMELDDLAFSGIGEFARQWLLISRVGEFSPDAGQHDLILNVGGSAGHAGHWRLRVTEGRQGADFRGRHWHVEMDPGNPWLGSNPGMPRRSHNAGIGGFGGLRIQ
jgi:hypothetical protein